MRREHRLAADIEDVRRHLGLDTVDLLAHSAGANIAYRHLERHGGRVARLMLVTPSPLGVEVSVDERRAVLDLRRDQPWHAAAAEAFERLQTGEVGPDDEDALGPIFYGRWDDETKAYAAQMDAERNPAAVAEFVTGFNPEASRAAAGRLAPPTLVLAGEYDIGNPPVAMARLTINFGAGRLQVLPRSGHFPWRDDPAAFVAAIG